MLPMEKNKWRGGSPRVFTVREREIYYHHNVWYVFKGRELVLFVGPTAYFIFASEASITPLRTRGGRGSPRLGQTSTNVRLNFRRGSLSGKRAGKL